MLPKTASQVSQRVTCLDCVQSAYQDSRTNKNRDKMNGRLNGEYSFNNGTRDHWMKTPDILIRC